MKSSAFVAILASTTAAVSAANLRKLPECLNAEEIGLEILQMNMNSWTDAITKDDFTQQQFRISNRGEKTVCGLEMNLGMPNDDARVMHSYAIESEVNGELELPKYRSYLEPGDDHVFGAIVKDAKTLGDICITEYSYDCTDLETRRLQTCLNPSDLGLEIELMNQNSWMDWNNKDDYTQQQFRITNTGMETVCDVTMKLDMPSSESRVQSSYAVKDDMTGELALPDYRAYLEPGDEHVFGAVVRDAASMGDICLLSASTDCNVRKSKVPEKRKLPECMDTEAMGLEVQLMNMNSWTDAITKHDYTQQQFRITNIGTERICNVEMKLGMPDDDARIQTAYAVSHESTGEMTLPDYRPYLEPGDDHVFGAIGKDAKSLDDLCVLSLDAGSKCDDI